MIPKQTFLDKRILCRYGRAQKKQVAEYIKNQLREDQIADQISMKEYIDPFTGNKNTKA